MVTPDPLLPLPSFQEALACHRARQWDRAEELYRRLLQQEPHDLRIPANLAALLAATSRTGEAVAVLDQGLAKAPRSGVLLEQRARLRWALGDQSAAIQDLRACVGVRAHEPKLFTDLGWWLRSSEGPQAALPVMQSAIALDPTAWLAWMRLAVLLHECGDSDQAITAIEKAHVLAPNQPSVRLNASILYLEIRQPQRAWDWVQPLLNQPEPVRGHLHQAARCLQELGQLTTARDLYDRCIQMDALPFDAHANAAVCSQELGEYADAEYRFQIGLSACSASARLHHNYGYLLLLQARFPDALNHIRWRWASDGLEKPYGSDLERLPDCSAPLFLWCEQGVGDQLLMAGFLAHPLLVSRTLTVQLDRRLIPLLKPVYRSVSFVPMGEPYALGPDEQPLSLLDLPCLLLRDAADLGQVRVKSPLLSAVPLAAHDSPIFPVYQHPFRLGVAWASANPVLGHDKSIPVQQLIEALSSLVGHQDCIEIVDLQYGDHLAEQAELRGSLGSRYHDTHDVDKMNDFVAFTDLVARCDAVLTISNVAAHVAGCLGVPTWLLISPGVAGLWYWHHYNQREMSLWYPSVRILRKAKRIDPWSLVLSMAVNEIVDFASERAS